MVLIYSFVLQVSKEMGEIIRLAVSQAQRRRGLFTSTNFRRINVTQSSTDPLCGKHSYFHVVFLSLFCFSYLVSANVANMLC